jgi:hypothetical protein
MGLSVEGLNCKRPIQCLASPKILTPSPPGECVILIPPPLVRGEDTLAGWKGGGWGVNILEDASHCSVLYIRKYFVGLSVFDNEGHKYRRCCIAERPSQDPERHWNRQQVKLWPHLNCMEMDDPRLVEFVKNLLGRLLGKSFFIKTKSNFF